MVDDCDLYDFSGGLIREYVYVGLTTFFYTLICRYFHTYRHCYCKY